MGAATPKVLLPLDGHPLLEYVLDAARAAGAMRIIVVIGAGRAQVSSAFCGRGVEFVVQESPRGTADAVLACRARLQDDEECVVLCGDAPLVKPETIGRLTREREQAAAEVAVLTAVLDDPGSYGRIVRQEGNRIARIVERLDAGDDIIGIKEVNSGAYSFRWGRVKSAVERIRPSRVSGEFYLTDLVAEIRSEGGRAIAVVASEPSEMLGANTPAELALIQSELRRRRGGTGA